jgi:hypothetical protein
MNKILKLTALALVTLVVLSPLVMAGSKPTFVHKPGFGNGGGFNHNFNNFNNDFNKFKAFSTGGVTFNTGKPFVPPTVFGPTFIKKPGFQFDNGFFFHNGRLIRR